MTSHKLVLKLFFENPASFTDAQAVPLFHTWIQSRALPDHLLIDVADYSHVHHAPGTLLVSHEANLALDHTAGRTGLLYQRKQPFAGASTLRQRIAELLKHTFHAAGLIETAIPGARFRRDEYEFKIADRLHAPATRETFAAVRPDLEAALADHFGAGELVLEFSAEPQRLFTVTIRSSSPATVTR